MNEREFTLRAALLAWNGDHDMPPAEMFDLAQAFAAEARKRGLFDEPTSDGHTVIPGTPAPSPLGASPLAQWARDEDAQRAELHAANVRAASREQAIKEAQDIGANLARDLDAAKALLREMAYQFERLCEHTMYPAGVPSLLARTKKFLND